MEAMSQTAADIQSTLLHERKGVFIPENTCDVTLVVEDGKQFKANRQVLSKASPFFEKLLNSDMRESKEGVVRLEMLSESRLEDILEFIYTGSVQILDEENARSLIEMADYLFLPQLQTLAGSVLAQKLDISNCISTYYFAERHQCEKLVSNAKQIILSNFTNVANTEDFLKMSNKEVEMWISSGDIDVSSEEDVFKIILAWIDHDKSVRKKYFAELFRHVRLIYVSSDYLRKTIATNDLVKGNEGCLDLAKNAMMSVDSKDFNNPSVTPRKSLQTPAIVVYSLDGYILCYFPREDSWRTLPTEPQYVCWQSMFSCQHGQLYFVRGYKATMARYNSFSNRWTTLPCTETRKVLQTFVNNEDEVYALVHDDRTACRECVSLWPLHENYRPLHLVPYSLCGKDHFSSITKYNPGLNVWEDITTFDLGSRRGICIVANDNYIYFIGGHECKGDRGYEALFLNDECPRECRSASVKFLSDANRYDLTKNKWDKIADIQQARKRPFGASAYGKVFITDDIDKIYFFKKTCEAYNEQTNEWQFIASLKIPLGRRHGNMMSFDDKLYVLDAYWDRETGHRVKIQCYDPDKNEWYEQTNCKMPGYEYSLCCLMRVFQARHLEKDLSRVDRRKCFIM